MIGLCENSCVVQWYRTMSENEEMLNKIWSMVEATKKKPKRKQRTYTEEQKQVLRDRLATARENKKKKQEAERGALVEPKVEKIEEKAEKVEQQLEKEAMKAEPDDDRMAKLLARLSSLENQLEELSRPKAEPKAESAVEHKPEPEPETKELDPEPPRAETPVDPRELLMDYIGLSRG